MALLAIAPTRSNLLNLTRQLEFALEGYDLLEQKRQLLVFELLARIRAFRSLKERRDKAVREIRIRLVDAALDGGRIDLARGGLGARPGPDVHTALHHQLGMALPQARVVETPPVPPAGFMGRSAQGDAALRLVCKVLQLLADYAAAETALLRISAELRKTQRRVNALARIVIPNHRETISYIRSVLEERERESLAVLKHMRNRLQR